ncbi:MAG: DUF1573 domain-containing protein [Pirellulales bacterium]|jgi:hypothetical protein|nr:DUF1573 domain-containing protein [Pirellulales bacterium]
MFNPIPLAVALLLLPATADRAIDFQKTCGQNSLWMACDILGKSIDIEEVDRLLPADDHGLVSFADLKGALNKLGFYPLAIETGLSQLQLVPPPAILHVKSVAGQNEGDHYVLFLGFDRSGSIALLDPPAPPTAYTADVFRKIWTGRVLAICKSPDEARSLLAALDRGTNVTVRNATFWGALAIAFAGCAFLFGFKNRYGSSLKAAIAALGLCAVSLPGCRPAPAAGLAPHLVLKEDHINLGIIPRSKPALARITLSNTGPGNLRVMQIGTSCSCTLAEPPSEVPPGKQGVLLIKVPKPEAGPKSARVLIRSNDPDSPHELFVSWYGESPPSFAPPKIDVTAEGGKPFRRTVFLNYASGDPQQQLSVKEIKTTGPDFQLRLISSRAKETVSSRQVSNLNSIVAELPFEFSCATVSGVIEGECTVTAELAGTVIHVPLSVRVQEAAQLAAAPKSLFVSGRCEQLEGVKRSLRITSRFSGKPRISFLPPTELLHSEVVEKEPGVFSVQIQITRRPEDNYQGRILVQIEDQAAAKCEIPISVLVFN